MKEFAAVEWQRAGTTLASNAVEMAHRILEAVRQACPELDRLSP